MGRQRFGVIEKLTGDRELVFEFFAVFSRLEYALKRAGFVRKRNGSGDVAEVDWPRFAETLHGRFAVLDAPDLKDAHAFLLHAPPRVQVLSGGGELRWGERPQRAGESEEAYVLRLVRTVRNNLFHGGKYPYPDGPVEDTARNDRLLECSLSILEQCLRLSPDVDLMFAEVP